jgi:hypothetical protein
MNFRKIPEIWIILSGTVYLVGLAISFLTAKYSFTLGFAFGGALMLLNAWASARKLRNADFPHRNRVMASVMGGFYVRLALLAVCLYALIRILAVDPLGLVTGLSVIPAGLLVMLALMYVANRRPGEV